MRKLLGLIAVIAVGALLSTPLAADVNVDVEITFGHFHERLAPHGSWIEVESHGWVWHPHRVDAGWQPYTRGRWVYNDGHGWVWSSSHEWGWATFHYGRWTYSQSRWVWVPGYQWSGAWVAWRHGEGHVGWAALPPRATWEVGIGIRKDSFNVEVDLSEDTWVFVSESKFTSTSIHTVVVPGKGKGLWKRTRYMGTVNVKGNKTYNAAIDINTAERISGKVTKVKLKPTRTLGASLVKDNDEGTVRVFMPRVKKGDVGPPKNIDKTKGLRVTRDEKHEAEKEVLAERHNKEARNKDDPDLRDRQRKEADKLRERHEKEKQEFEKSHGKSEKDGAGKDKPKRDGAGKDRPESDRPRKDDPKGDRPSKGEPKGDRPSKGEPKKGEPKKEQPGRDEPKKGGSGKDNPKKESPGKGNPKKN